jgi:hypothetical protein
MITNVRVCKYAHQRSMYIVYCIYTVLCLAMFFSGINNVCRGIVWGYLAIYNVFNGTVSRDKKFLKA